MKIQVVTSKPDTKNTLLVQPIFEAQTDQSLDSVTSEFIKENPKFGKLYETQYIYGDSKILLIGLGKKDKFNFDKLQNLAGVATKWALNKAKEITIEVPMLELSPEKVGEALALGVEIATFDMASEYKSEKEKPSLQAVNLLITKADRGYQDGVKKGQLLAESINLARRLGDMPANEMTPTYFLKQAQKIARENKLKIVIIDEKQAKKLGMGGFVGVAQGSEEPSYIITLEYVGNLKSKDKWGLVGKGITFDSGGISIKPSASMNEMKYDMCGAAAVLATMTTIAKMRLKTNAIGVMCVTENLPGGKAQRPGDIVKLYSGKTAEVLNTDAEGRMVLVDGLTLAQKKGATKLIDLATLTGAVIVALGSFATGIMGNHPAFIQDMIVAGNIVGERYWEFPMFEEYNEMIKSDFADMTNIGHGATPGAAGPITAAKFLEAVIEGNRPWVHLDIAGTAWDMNAKPYRSAGATGVGIKTLVELITNS
jgi:leucyl aminopeptidase